MTRVEFQFKCGHRGAANLQPKAAAAIVLALRKKLCADCSMNQQAHATTTKARKPRRDATHEQ